MQDFLSTILHTAAKVLMIPIVFVASLAGYQFTTPSQVEQLGATLPIAGQTYTLAGSGASAAATSIILSSLTIPQTGYKIQDSDMSSTFYLTLEPGNRTKQEIISCTTVTQNANDSATLSGCTRGLLPISPYTASSSYAFSHGGGTSVIFSNPPQFYNQFLAADNDGTISGVYTFTSSPLVPTPTATSAAANKGYIDGIAIAGSPIMSTSLAGIAKLSTTAASTTNPIVVGDNDTRLPTQDENNALVGTSGTPSSSNKYVTNDDTSGTGSVVRKSFVKFGGTGADGALTITTGTTTINLGGAAVVTKNYTSISITGDGALAFSNPHANGTVIILKSQGDVTLTSSATPVINLRNIGALNGGAGLVGGNATSGSVSNQRLMTTELSAGLLGVRSTSGNGAGGAGGVLYGGKGYYSVATTSIFKKYIAITPGSGGGGGGASYSDGGWTGANGGAGGRGAGAMIIECGGAWNFTSTLGINISGTNGTNGSNSANGGGGGGGGGGAGGMFVALYNTLTANTGTFVVSGGNGGNGGTGTSNGKSGGGGGGAGMYNGAGGAGGNGEANGNAGSVSETTGSGAGTAGTGGTNAGGGGGGGTAGEYLVTANTEF